MPIFSRILLEPIKATLFGLKSALIPSVIVVQLLVDEGADDE
jgi:hypothetical protein